MTTTARHIAHFDLDSFYVSVERLQNPDLVGVPLIVGGYGDRGVVSSCSYEARRSGVRSAMPIVRAKQLCPQAFITPPNMKLYAEYSGLVTHIIENNVPVFEKASIDEFYVDLSGMDRFFDPYQHATEIRQLIIRETGLPISFGFASNKTIAKIATGKAKPNGQLRVPAGTEKEFLAPLSVAEIPMAGEKTQQILMQMGIHKISQLQQTPVGQLEHILGKMGRVLWEKSQGIDHSPVEPYLDRKSISTETTFDKDTSDRNYLSTVLLAMCTELGHKIRRAERYAGVVALKIRYNNFETHSKQLSLPNTQTDSDILKSVKNLFEQLYTTNAPIRLIGIRLGNLSEQKGQSDLFNNDDQNDKLYKALDNIKEKFGSSSIKPAAMLQVKKKSHNPYNGTEL